MLDAAAALPAWLLALGSAFSFGLSHAFGACLYSCLPVYLPVLLGYGDDPRRGLGLSLGFAAGRFAGYLLLGAAAAWLGAGFIDLFESDFPRIGSWAVSLLGLVSVAQGALLLARTRPRLLGEGRCESLLARARPLDRPALSAATLGFVSTITPCVPVFTFLLLPFALGRVTETVPVTLAFGLGANLPFIAIGVGVALGVRSLPDRLAACRRRLEQASGAALVAFGLAYLVLGGWYGVYAIPDIRAIAALLWPAAGG